MEGIGVGLLVVKWLVHYTLNDVQPSNNVKIGLDLWISTIYNDIHKSPQGVINKWQLMIGPSVKSLNNITL